MHGSVLSSTLGQISLIYIGLWMQFDEIKELASAPNVRGKTQAIQKGVATQIIIFVKLYWNQDKQGTPMDDEILTITPEECEELEHNLWAQQIDALDGTSPPPPTTMGSHPSGPLQDFQKGICQDMSSFPTIKNIEQWDNWRQIFEATAKAQGVNDVLDLKYMPSNPTKAQVFDAHQSYIYAILLNTVKDSFLKSIVINHNNRKVQECWEKIITACEASTSAEIKANSLLQYITSVKFDDGKWRGTSKDFIIYSFTGVSNCANMVLFAVSQELSHNLPTPSRFRCSRTLWAVSKSFAQFVPWPCRLAIHHEQKPILFCRVPGTTDHYS